MQKEVYEFMAHKTGGTIVERRKCRWTGEDFAIFQGDVDLLDKISPVIDGKKYRLQLPTLSPMARMIRRMMFRNERGLYNVTSMDSKLKIPSMYHLDTGISSMTADEREKTDMGGYGIDYNLDKSFFQQFSSLYKRVPKIGLISLNNENGKYDNYSGNNKNTYLNADIIDSENVSYSTTVKHVKNGYDLLQVRYSELVYDCMTSSNLTKCVNVWYSSNCYDCGFCITCKNCSNCWFCDNIENKQNYIFNKQVTREEIQAIKDRMKTYDGFKTLQDIFEKKVWNVVVRPNRWEINCEGTIGSTIYDSQNAFFCFDSHDIQDCRYCMVAEHNHDCMDTTIFNPNASGVYEAVCGGFLTKSYACVTGWESSNMYFCDSCVNCEYMIGCSGMKNKKYCILNKQYTKQLWNELAEKIIVDIMKDNKWGEFFPSYLSPFPYNDTVVVDYFPVKKVQDVDGNILQKEVKEGFGVVIILEPDKFISKAILDLGGEEEIKITRRTKNQDIDIPDNLEIVDAEDLPGDINDVSDFVCSQIILCSKTKRPYRISRLELDFYRNMQIALPRVHQDLRHKRRTLMRPPRVLYYRLSDKSGEAMVSNYHKDVLFKVYKQKEYELLMYG